MFVCEQSLNSIFASLKYLDPDPYSEYGSRRPSNTDPIQIRIQTLFNTVLRIRNYCSGSGSSKTWTTRKIKILFFILDPDLWKFKADPDPEEIIPDPQQWVHIFFFIIKISEFICQQFIRLLIISESGSVLWDAFCIRIRIESNVWITIAYADPHSPVFSTTFIAYNALYKKIFLVVEE